MFNIPKLKIRKSAFSSNVPLVSEYVGSLQHYHITNIPTFTGTPTFISLTISQSLKNQCLALTMFLDILVFYLPAVLDVCQLRGVIERPSDNMICAFNLKVKPLKLSFAMQLYRHSHQTPSA